MTQAVPTFPSTTTTKAVLTAFVSEYLVDVPAVHRDGQYLIEASKLESHIEGLEYDDLVQISLTAEEFSHGL